MIDLVEIPFGFRYIGYWGDGYGNQVPVETYKDVIDFINEHLSIDNIGISVCTYKDGYPYLLYLPFDFDSENLKEAWLDAIKLYNKFVSKNYETCLTYSGRRGFHVFLKVIPKIYSKRVIRHAQMMFKSMLSLKTMDERIFGDIRRLMRVPYTYNMGGNMCNMIDSNDGKSLNLNHLIDENAVDNPYEDYSTENLPEFHDYPCIEKLIKDREFWEKHHPRKSFQPSQEVRFTWTILRLSEGFTYDEILEEAKKIGWDDVDDDKTIYQINHIAGGGYVPYSCRSLRDMGYCIIKDCPYRNVDREMMKEVGIL